MSELQDVTGSGNIRDMTRNRTPQEKVGDWNEAYEPIRDAITPDPMRQMITNMTSVPMEGVEVAAYASLVQSSIHLARIVAANDRAAAIAAAMLTAAGVSRPVIDLEGE